MTETRERLEARADEDDLEFFMTMFVDLHGRPCAKLVPVSAMDVVCEGAGFAGFAVGPMGQSPASPDMIAAPDADSYFKLPWRDGVAVVMCDVKVEGELWPYTPRVILGRALERLRDERDMALKVGVEAEYHLVSRTEGGGIEVADRLDTQDRPCYDAQGLARMFDHLSTMSRYMNQLGYENYANDHEDGNGQFEQNFKYADAMTTADRLIFFRYMAHVLAGQTGMAATFLPKPFARLTGNGLHMNTSLWTSGGDQNLFELAAGDGEADDEHGLGLTPLGYQFCAGVLEHATAMAAITNPTVNSYKRFGVGAPNSGATWAPSYLAYGGNNRTQMMCISEGNRLEIRSVDGSANPYLAFSAVLAAGLDGVDRQLDPGEPNVDNLHAMDPAELAAKGMRRMPPTLLHAADELRGHEVMREALGHTGTEWYSDYFADVKADEFRQWHAQVSDWEVDRYLTLF
ncbi:MAG: type III glutamate--ammonia ligase [Ilumatobacteraceae bacterium]